MGLLKSLFNAARSDSEAYEKTVYMNSNISGILSDKTVVSPTELDNTVRMVTGSNTISQKVLKSVGFTSIENEPKVINYNKVFDAILEELNK